MTPDEFEGIRRRLGVSEQTIADALQLGPGGVRRVLAYASGRAPIPGPVALSMRAFSDGWRPSHMRETFEQAARPTAAVLKLIP
jgi:hypothetical protein